MQVRYVAYHDTILNWKVSMATKTAASLVSSQNDRLKIFLHALLFVAGFSLVFIVGWGGSEQYWGNCSARTNAPLLRLAGWS